MSIGNLQDASGSFDTYDVHHAADPPRRMWMFNCRNCGFEPEDPIIPPRRCPKCGCGVFQRVMVPGALLLDEPR